MENLIYGWMSKEWKKTMIKCLWEVFLNAAETWNLQTIQEKLKD